MMEPTTDPKVFDVRGLIRADGNCCTYMFTTIHCGVEAVEEVFYRGHELYECRLDPDVDNAKRQTWQLSQKYLAGNTDGALGHQAVVVTEQEVNRCLIPKWPAAKPSTGINFPPPLDENAPPGRRLDNAEMNRYMSGYTGGLLLQLLIDAKWVRERHVSEMTRTQSDAVNHLLKISGLSIGELGRRTCCSHSTMTAAKAGSVQLSSTVLANLAWESRKHNQWVLSWLFKRWQRSARYRSHEKGGYR